MKQHLHRTLIPWVHLPVPLQGVTSWGLTPLPSTVNTHPRKNAGKNLELPQYASSSNCINCEESSLTMSLLHVVIGVQATRPSVWTWPEWWTTTSSFVENLARTTLNVKNLCTKRLLSPSSTPLLLPRYPSPYFRHVSSFENMLPKPPENSCNFVPGSLVLRRVSITTRACSWSR